MRQESHFSGPKNNVHSSIHLLLGTREGEYSRPEMLKDKPNSETSPSPAFPSPATFSLPPTEERGKESIPNFRFYSILLLTLSYYPSWKTFYIVY
jgi:hypothetical protein